MPEAADIEGVSKLVSEVVDSFEKLETLVQVVRMGSAVAAPGDVAKAVSMPLDEVEKCFKALRSDGLFDPSGPWAPAVAALVQMYDSDRIAVFELMTKTALARVRKQAARVFADAFVLRPGKKKGDSNG